MKRRLAALIFLLTAVFVLGLVVNMGSAQNFGANWTGQYYNCLNFSCPVFQSRVDTAINFNFGAGAPISGMNADNFSIRWTGVQNFPVTGVYQFSAIADDSIKVFFDGVVIIDVPSPQAAPTVVSLNVTAGPHTIIVEYQELSLNALVQFQWSEPGAAGQTATEGPTPTAGPTNTPTVTALPPIPPGAITATVIRASVLNVRDAPSTGGNRLDRIFRGQTYAVVGRNANATWFLLQLSGKQAWAWGYYLFINGNEFTPPVVSGASTIGLAGAPDYGVVAQSQAVVKLRALPNVVSAQIGRVTWGSFVPVIGRTADGFWWKVVWKNTFGWVYSPYFKVFQGNVANVPVLTE